MSKLLEHFRAQRGDYIPPYYESSLYKQWKSMRYRVKYVWQYNITNICKTWDKFHDYQQWAIAHGWFEGCHIHRVDNDGDYEPNNCVFLTAHEHAMCKGRRTTYQYRREEQ